MQIASETSGHCLNAAYSVHAIESLDRLLHLGYGSTQYRAEGFTFTNPRFVNRYLNEELYILVRFRVREIAEDYFACFQRESLDSRLGTIHVSGISPRHPVQRLDIGIGHVDVLSDAPVVNKRPARDEKTMLVDIIKTMESPENVIPSLVWFDSADKVNDILPHSIYFSAERGLVFWGARPVVGDREHGAGGWFSAVGDDQGVGQVIEGASEVLEDISSQGAKAGWDDQIPRQTIERLLCLGVALYDDGIWVRTGELAKLDLKVSEVMLGPLEF
jgi:hypothetical protein